MKRSNIILIVSLLALIVLYTILEIYRPKVIDWSYSYSKDDNIPYGTEITYNLLENIFPDSYIEVSKEPIYDQLMINWEADAINTNYIFIGSTFEPTALDFNILLDYVRQGNNVFIAANQISDEVMDTLQLDLDLLNNISSISFNSSDSTTIQFTNPNLTKQQFKLKKNYNFQYFNKVDSCAYLVGTMNNKHPNFIKIYFGKGSILLHSNPLAFTNYYMLYNNNHSYIETALSMLPDNYTFWDEYYVHGRDEKSDSSLRYIFYDKYLKGAWYIMIIGVILFMIFKAKREQRLIPIIKPLVNSTLEFASTIGNLYFEKKDNKNISDKAITYFRHYVRTKIYIDIFDDPEYVVESLNSKTSLTKPEITKMINYINYCKKETIIGDNELKKLNSFIEFFKTEYNK